MFDFRSDLSRKLLLQSVAPATTGGDASTNLPAFSTPDRQEVAGRKNDE